MKTINLPGAARTCDGVSRRDFLKVGTLSCLGLTLADLLQLRAAQAEPGAAREKNCILLFMNGGPSHLDTWDPKPDAPAEVRGEFNALDTNVAGVRICEHLPKMAQLMDRYAIVRSITSPEASHERACHYMLTGYRVEPTLEFPAYGSVILREKGFRTTLPPYIAVPNTLRGGGPGYMGPVYQPFSTGDPAAGNFRVRDLSPAMDDARMQARMALLRDAEADFRKNDPDHSIAALDRFYEKAYDLIHSPEAKQAFDLSREPAALREAYGKNSLGQGCLLARRLIEAGARFITLSRGGWDTHGQNFKQLKEQRLPELDAAFSTLLTDLQARGMLQDTLVVWMGDFGRTPKINKNAGRDHWSRAQSVVFAGGGVKGGQVVGTTDDTASIPTDRPVTPEDMAATIYHLLGIDTSKRYATNNGRTIPIVEHGEVVKELAG
jgi:uncharacterized protein (DUF1501 family)